MGCGAVGNVRRRRMCSGVCSFDSETAKERGAKREQWRLHALVGLATEISAASPADQPAKIKFFENPQRCINNGK